MYKRLILPLILLFLSVNVAGQSAIDSFSESSYSSGPPDLVDETIIRISESRRIIILSNNKDSFSRGDFITILLDKKPIVRGLVAKINAQISAIKVTKIYNLEFFNLFRSSYDVQVLRGDDSYYREKKDQANDDEFKVIDEDDLFDETTILDEDLLTEKESKKMIIKNDNLISFGIAFVSGFDDTGEAAKVQQINASFARQIHTNIWAEFYLGIHTLKNYPVTGLDTAINNYMLRVKYAFDAPFFFVFMPYFGFQFVSADSPAAGTNTNSAKAKQEIADVDSLKENKPVIGVSVMKRLVPGWFMKGDIGNDVINVGLTLEF